MKLWISLVSSVLFIAGSVHAAPPEEVRFHGVISQLGGQPVADGTYDFFVEIYDLATGGNVVFDQTITANVAAGAYTVVLSSMTGELTAAFSDSPRFLQITVDNEQLSPRQQISSVPYALSTRSIIPTGAILPFAGEALPVDMQSDYYFCDGEQILYSSSGSVVAENQALFDVIGYRYGKVVENNDQDVYFRLPDYRGTFLRGWGGPDNVNNPPDPENDPDRLSRSGFSAIDGSVQTGDLVGSFQQDEFGTHFHYSPNRQRDGYSTVTADGVARGSVDPVDEKSWKPTNNDYSRAAYGTTLEGGSESRPVNISVMYIIKR